MERMVQDIMQAILFMEVFNMNNIRKHIVPIFKIVTFAIIFMIIFTTLTYILKPSSVDLDNIAGFYGEKKNSLDMVYIGGSANFVYWEPLRSYEKEGIASYNFGANTIQAEAYIYLVKEVLKYQNPEIIIIDARAFQYRDKDQPPTEVAYRNFLTGTPFSLEKAEFIEKYVPKILKEDTLSYHFDIIKYHRSLAGVDYRAAVKKMLHLYENPLKGFYFVPKVDSIVEYEFKTDKVTPMEEDTVKILDELLTFLKTTNHKYLFIVSPYEETEAHKENFNFVERKVKEAGFDFLDANDYNKEMQLNFDTDFYNENHVNIFGADKYTDFLTQYLKEHYNLPDRRNDKKYDSWNRLLPNWNDQVDLTKETITKIMNGEE